MFDPSLKIVKAKVRTNTVIENLRELPRTQANTFSLTGLVSGVYILDIIAQKDNREDLAYETIMVILAPGETTITANLQIINNIITKVKNNVRTEIVFRDENDDGSGDDGGRDSSGNGCSNKPGSAGMGFPYQKATQCQKLEFDDCKRTGENSDRCETAQERFSDDCQGFANQQECDEHFSVPLNPIIPTSPLPDCSDVPAGTSCSREEGTIVEDLPLCSDAAPGSECRDEAGNMLRQPISSEKLPESEILEPEPVPEQGAAGCLNAGQTEGGEDDECIQEDTPENRAEIARQATEEEPTQPLTEESTTVPQFGMEEDLDPDQLGLQQQDDGGLVEEEDQIAEDSNDIGGTDTDIGISEDTDTSDGDDVENSVSSDGDDNGGEDNSGGGGGDSGDADDEGGGG
jgi:hypothetical protein